MFIAIMFSIFIMQIILISFTGVAFAIYPHYGLTIQQWGICILIGSFSLIVSVILKLLPIAKNTHG